MIQRIHSIKGIGRLNKISLSSEKLAPLTLIYAENGRGKSTFAQVLLSLKSGNTYLLNKRANGHPYVKLLVNQKQIILEDNIWSELYPDIEVFDANFINENVVAGNINSTEQRHSLVNWVFGSERIMLETEIANIGKIIDSLRNTNKAIQTQITSYCGQMDIDEFLKIQENPTIESDIQALKSKIKGLKDKDTIMKTSDFQSVNLPKFSLEALKKLLETQLGDIAENAQELVREHLSKHKNITEDWIEDGIEVNITNCPFCGQSFQDTTLFDAYQTYFGESYKSLLSKLRLLRSEVVDDIFNDRHLSELLKPLEINENLIDFWKDYTEISLNNLKLTDIRLSIDTLKEEVLKLLDIKERNLLSNVALSTELIFFYEIYQKNEVELIAYNKQIETYNQSLAQIKQGDIGKLPEMQIELEKLHIQKNRYQPLVISLCDGYKSTVENIKQKLRERTQLNNKLKTTAKNLLMTYGEAVEKYLQDFQIDIKLDVQSLKTNMQGKETIEYNMIVDGNKNKFSSEDAFGYNLSEGDKGTVALAFFLARLDTMDLSNKIIVFDDPISSQDQNRRRETRYKILELTKKAKQVIVLSHDAMFLRQLYRPLRWVTIDKKALQFERISDNNSNLVTCNILEITQSQYYKDYELVSNYLAQNIGNLDEVTKSIRRLLEEQIRSRFPSVIKQEHTLGQIIQSMVSNQSSELAKLKHRISELNRINDLTSDDGHGNGANLSDGDVKNCARMALEIITDG